MSFTGNQNILIQVTRSKRVTGLGLGTKYFFIHKGGIKVDN